MSRGSDIGDRVVVDPDPLKEILRRAEKLKMESADGIIFPCEYCQKVFKFKYEYERHVKIHSGDRPWECPECLKSFSRKDNMRAHMKIHTGELVRHVCQLCGKSYGRKYDLQVHERVHSGERPFECGSCGKSFISTSRLRAHQLIHCKNIYLPRHVRNKKLHLLTPPVHGRRRVSPTSSVEDGDMPLSQVSKTQFLTTPLIITSVTSSLPSINQSGHFSNVSTDTPISISSDDEEDEDSFPDPGALSLNLVMAQGEESNSSLDADDKILVEEVILQRRAELEAQGIKLEDMMIDASELAHQDFHVVIPTDPEDLIKPDPDAGDYY